MLCPTIERRSNYHPLNSIENSHNIENLSDTSNSSNCFHLHNINNKSNQFDHYHPLVDLTNILNNQIDILPPSSSSSMSTINQSESVNLLLTNITKVHDNSPIMIRSI